MSGSAHRDCGLVAFGASFDDVLPNRYGLFVFRPWDKYFSSGSRKRPELKPGVPEGSIRTDYRENPRRG